MIFGVNAPKIIDDSDNEHTLDYITVIKDEPETQVIFHESKINGSRNFYHKGYHWIYEVRMNIFRYDDPSTKFESLHDLLGTEVTLYRHKDKDAFKDSSGDVVPFFLEELRPFYLTTNYTVNGLKDGLIITFRSTKFVDLTQSLWGTLRTENTGDNITDEDGNQIII